MDNIPYQIIIFSFSQTSGPDYGLYVVLQNSKMYEESQSDGVRTFPPFKIAIHDPMSIADLRRSGVEVEPGYISTFLITPSQIVTSWSAKDLPEKDRQCRFNFESRKLKLFKEYTQSACLFECQLRDAYNSCQCIPWDYPQFQEGIPICNRFSQDCFEKAMADTNSSSTCDCPFDCATTRHCVQNDINSSVVYFFKKKKT